jgi:hypothetical protein
VADRRAYEPPQRVCGKADREEREQQRSETLVRDGVEGTLLVDELATTSQRKLERENPDDRVDESTRDEAAARQPLERP